MSDKRKHQPALELFGQGLVEDATRLLVGIPSEQESSELWNDYATAQFVSRYRVEAAKGYRRALERDTANQPAMNLGMSLRTLGGHSEAVPLLERTVPGLTEPECACAVTVPKECRPSAKQPQREVLPSPQEEFRKLAEVNSSEENPLRILVVHEILPQTDRNGSDVRFMQVLRELVVQGHELTYVARNGALREHYAAALENLGIKLWANDAERLRHLGIDSPVEWRFEELLRATRFDIAILYLWFWSGTSVPEHYLDEIRRVSPATRIAVLTEDQHGLRETRMANLSGIWSDFERGYDYENRETEICRRADFVLVISEDDRRGFLDRIPGLNIEQVPMVAHVAPEGPGFADRADLLFVGNFDNLANRDGVEWMLRKAWPRLRQQLPGVSLALVGHNLPADLAREQVGIRAIGHVADLDPLFAQYRVFVSPVRFGTGIKTKNLAALSHGLPLVTTTVGAEGMHLTSGDSALIGDTPEAFADAVICAYTDEGIWRNLSRGGRQHVSLEFSETRLRTAIRKLICQARTIAPKVDDPSHVWSYLLVEKRCPEVLTHKPTRYRTVLRFVGYVGLAEEFLVQNRPINALEQLRHMFGTIRGGIPANPLFFYALALLARCYRENGDRERAAQYQLSARLRTTVNDAAAALRPAPRDGRNRKRKRYQIALSIVVPTYNRKATLRACLANLAAQSELTDPWEVIVVDDGSTDGTEDLCRRFPPFYPLEYIHQENRGAGAARRAAIERARGEYLLLINDDTMADPNLLAEHLRVHRNFRRHEKIAVLGDFSYPSEARERALTCFLSRHPMLFPQVTLEPGLHSKNAYFIACNLSIRRDAVESVGSFDAAFRVAEDTELGIRMRAAGYQILYHPAAVAVHDHLQFTLEDLLHRAYVYGRTQLQLLRKHPQLLSDGSGPFGRLDEPSIEKIRERLDRGRDEVLGAVNALRKFDSVDFAPFFGIQAGQDTLADQVLKMFACALPDVFLFFILESFLTAWDSHDQHDKLSKNQACTTACAEEKTPLTN
jgi:GT2 family glycosyltransferase/glycosyltransferase involved in cell wall biosynthesis